MADAANKARLAARARAMGEPVPAAPTPPTVNPQYAADDIWARQKVGTTGKTQAQLDAEEGQKAAAEARERAAKLTADASKLTTSSASLKAAEAARKAEEAARAAAEKKAAAEAARKAEEAEKARKEREAEAARQAAILQRQIDELKAAGLLAEARRLEEARLAAEKYANDNAALQRQIEEQAAAAKLAYDTAAQDKADAIKIERRSAYEILKEEFTKYGLGSLVESVEALILSGTPKSEATLKLRATPQYQLRFAGNTQRLAAGKNLYDESTYLALENDFQASFEAYGQKSLLGNTRESAQAMFAEYIGSDKSPDEIKNRIRLAVDEVSNRKDIRSEFQKYFPEITDTDLVSYFLKPKETLSTLTSKVRIAQIGSAASAQGLDAKLSTATDLEQLGLTEQQARTGYQRVATDLPTIEKLGDIDKTDISQTTAENAYLKGLASEQRKIDKAAERERSRFAQSSGMNKVSLTDVKPAGQY
jgi:hypothetical protein